MAQKEDKKAKASLVSSQDIAKRGVQERDEATPFEVSLQGFFYTTHCDVEGKKLPVRFHVTFDGSADIQAALEESDSRRVQEVVRYLSGRDHHSRDQTAMNDYKAHVLEGKTVEITHSELVRWRETWGCGRKQATPEEKAARAISELSKKGVSRDAIKEMLISMLGPEPEEEK